MHKAVQLANFCKRDQPKKAVWAVLAFRLPVGCNKERVKLYLWVQLQRGSRQNHQVAQQGCNLCLLQPGHRPCALSRPSLPACPPQMRWQRTYSGMATAAAESSGRLTTQLRTDLHTVYAIAAKQNMRENAGGCAACMGLITVCICCPAVGWVVVLRPAASTRDPMESLASFQ